MAVQCGEGPEDAILGDILYPRMDPSSIAELVHCRICVGCEARSVDTTKYPVFPMTSEELTKQLAGNSEARTSASADFQKLARNIERYTKQKKRPSITLNEAKFLEERKELDADKEEEKQFEDQVNGSDEVVKRDFYFNEVLAITADYVSSLNKNKIAATQR